MTSRRHRWPWLAGGVVAALFVATLAVVASRLGPDPDHANTLLFAGWCLAMLVLFSIGVLLPLEVRVGGWRRRVYGGSVVTLSVLATLAANLALYHHDVHFDLSQERLSTPSPTAVAVAKELPRDVRLTYFYQAQDPSGRRAKELLEILARRYPRLRLQTVDPDRQPRLAETYGVRLYNAAVIEVDGRRVQVQSTDDTDIALGIVRALRQHDRIVCFIEGHGEYSIDNFEFHTHFETLQHHAHSGSGQATVLTEEHGAGRLRRALESLGLAVRKTLLASLTAIPSDCAAVVDVNPRTTWLPAEADVLQAYLAAGGRALLMYDVGFAVEARLAGLLAGLGIALPDEVVIDPVDHYSTDIETLAVPVYEDHPITRKIALTFYPGARPIELLPSRPGVTVTRLFTSSRDSYTRSVHPRPERLSGAPGTTSADTQAKAPRILAVAMEGTVAGAPPGMRPFRTVVVGDADFSSNSFFPYMANSDLAISMLRWVMGEEGTPSARPRIPALPLIVLTKRQMQGIFLVVELLLPLAVIVVGSLVWWKRR